MNKVLDQFKKQYVDMYRGQWGNSVVAGLKSRPCSICGGAAIEVTVNPQWNHLVEQGSFPETFEGYPVFITYTQPYILM